MYIQTHFNVNEHFEINELNKTYTDVVSNLTYANSWRKIRQFKHGRTNLAGLTLDSKEQNFMRYHMHFRGTKSAKINFLRLFDIHNFPHNGFRTNSGFAVIFECHNLYL